MNTDNFSILLEVQRRVKIFIDMVAAAPPPEHENGTPPALQTGRAMIFFKQA